MSDGVLSNKDILSAIADGTIIIDEFKEDQLANCSYDVTLGERFWRFSEHRVADTFSEDYDEPQTLYNMYDENAVTRAWQLCDAKQLKKYNRKLKNISQTDKVIWLMPGETILGHTNEFIGGRKNITTMMKARSSVGRNFLEVCKCAGWGDIGYVNRWTMEITNNSKCVIPLVVGRRIAQIVFMYTGEVVQDYTEQVDMKYGTKLVDIEEIKASWNPQDMLPKMWRDREVKALKQGDDGVVESEKKKKGNSIGSFGSLLRANADMPTFYSQGIRDAEGNPVLITDSMSNDE